MNRLIVTDGSRILSLDTSMLDEWYRSLSFEEKAAIYERQLCLPGEQSAATPVLTEIELFRKRFNRTFRKAVELPHA